MAEHFLCRRDELPPEGEAREFPCGPRMVCVATVNGETTAIDNVCIHKGGPLGQGVIDGGKIVCPWHGWAFDPKTGEVAHKWFARQMVYRIRIDGDEVKIEL